MGPSAIFVSLQRVLKIVSPVFTDFDQLVISILVIVLNSNRNKIGYLKNFLKMNRTLSTMLIAGALIIVGLNACTKQDYAPVPSTTPPPAQQAKLNLVTSEWTSRSGGIYVSTFQNILSNLPISNGSRVNVYADLDGQSKLISGSAVIYKGHPLWASINRSDVTISYSCPEAPMPFQTLHIVVAVE